MINEKGVGFSKPLTLGAIAQIADPEQYVATRVFPVVMADSIEGTYKYFNKADLGRYEVEMRKPGASYKKVTLDLDTKAFNCKNYGLAYPLPVEYAEELGADIMQTGATYLYDQGLKTLEYQLAETFLATGGYELADATPTVKWGATTGSNPIADVKASKKAIREAGHGTAKFALMTEDVFNALCENENILDRLAVDTLRVVNQEAQIASILGLQEIFVITETTATNKFLLFCKNETAPKENPNAGLIVLRNYAKEVKDAKGIGVTNPYFDEDCDSEVIKLKLRFDMIKPATSLAQLILPL